MKNRIVIVIALISISINCFFGIGCTPPSGYIAIDSQSALMNPTFCLYIDPYFQKQSRIGSIKIEKPLRSSSEEKKRWRLDSPLKRSQTVWELALKFPDTDNIFIALWGWLWVLPVPCLTYGEVPWGYEEKVKALPLEPEELYIVSVDATPHRRIAPLRFIIRLDDTGTPDRVEYYFKSDYIF